MNLLSFYNATQINKINHIEKGNEEIKLIS